MKAHIITVPDRSAPLRRLVHSFSLCKSIDQITIHIDHEYKGPWFNTLQALTAIASGTEICLISQDDIKPLPTAIDAHINVLKGHLTDPIGLISLFTPPRKEFQEISEKGFDGFNDNNFLWAQFYMISPEFAQDVIECNELIDRAKAKYHDEVRFRFAAQKYKKRIVTLCHSFARHDLSVKSTLGTPSAIGSVVRDTKSIASVDQSFEALNLKVRNSANDLHLEI